MHKERLYHLISLRNNRVTRLTGYATTHKKCMIIKSKFNNESIPFITVIECNIPMLDSWKEEND